MNLTLIGMPGAGKSVIGKELAHRLNFRFIDPDQLMRQHLGLSLGAILARLGDEMFLQLEEEIVLRLDDFDRSIVSPGGSVV